MKIDRGQLGLRFQLDQQAPVDGFDPGAGDLDLIEANEAFAAQACAVNKDMGWDVDKVNVNGGAIALGHPIGATGARIVGTMAKLLAEKGSGRGLISVCTAGGMGVSAIMEAAPTVT